MDIKNIRFDSDKYGYSYIFLDIDGKKAKIGAEQKTLRDGFVFLGADFESVLPPVTLPADPANGRLSPTELHGFSDDPRLVKLAKRFHEEINSDNFIPHDVELPKT